MKYSKSTPRHLRSYLVRTIDREERPLWLLSPKHTGDKLWRFAINHNGVMILVGKGVANRDIGRIEAVKRFGCKAKEIKVPKRLKSKAA